MYIISKQNVIAIYCLIVFEKEDVLAETFNELQILGK